jgi:hypothetical protein
MVEPVDVYADAHARLPLAVHPDLQTFTVLRDGRSSSALEVKLPV